MGWGIASVRRLAVTALMAVSVGAAAQTAGSGTSGAGSGPLFSPLTVDYGFSATQSYNDNYGFTGRSTWITTVGPSAAFKMDSESVKLTGNVGLFATHFSNKSAGQGQTTTPRFSVAAEFLQDRQTFSLFSSFYRDRSFSTAAPATGTSIPTFQTTNAQRNIFSFSPGYSYALTERLSASANYGYTTTYYDEVQAGLYDSTSNSLSGGLNYRLTEVDQVGVSISVSKVTTSPSTTSSDSVSPQVTWSRSWSERTTTSVSLGLSDSRIKNLANQKICPVPIFSCITGETAFETITANTESRSRTPSYNASVTSQLAPSTSVSARISRGTSPSVGGSLIDTESYGVSATQSFSERITGSLGYTHSSVAFTGTTSGSSNTLQSIGSTLSYSLQDNWSLNAGASWSRSSVNSTSPDAFAMFVTIAKTWPNNRLWP